MRLRQVYLAAVILLLPCVAANVYACQCREHQPPCAQYREADAVFVGSVTNIVSADDPQSMAKAADEYKIGFEKVSFKLERVFRGVEGGSVEMIDWMTSCRYGFRAGGRYLVYAYFDPATKTLSTHTCSRTSEVSKAAADLDYIAKLATVAPATAITGVLADGDKRLSNVRVTAESEGKLYRSVSDQTGWFNLSVPAPGKYKLRIFLPLNVGVAGPSDLLDKISGVVKTKRHYVVEYEVEVQSGGCTFVDVPLFIFAHGARG
jgi:hypothetical protein